MDALERKILIKGRKVLEDSTITNWTMGDIEQFEKWSKRMKTSIKAFLEMTEPLIEEDNEDSK